MQTSTISRNRVGLDLLYDPTVNKVRVGGFFFFVPRWVEVTCQGTAFSTREQDRLGLRGLVPPRVLTIDEQVKLTYHNLCQIHEPYQKYAYLMALEERNETLFYRLVLDHVEEVLLMYMCYVPWNESLFVWKLRCELWVESLMKLQFSHDRLLPSFILQQSARRARTLACLGGPVGCIFHPKTRARWMLLCE